MPLPVVLFLFFLSAVADAQLIIHVPADQPTIQAAIGVAGNGDTVLVAPGAYTENLDFLGKAITIKSAAGAAVTILDGNAAGPVVTFKNGEGPSSILDGFTIQNGSGGVTGGGGIDISGSSPVVRNNWILNNKSCAGSGLYVYASASALIENNTISDNQQAGCSGGVGGAGIALVGGSSVQILNNVITNNRLIAADGAGISLFAAGTPVLQGNIIRGNLATGISPAAQGGGIWIVNASNALIVDNVITGNTAGQGGGIAWIIPVGQPGPVLVNNTIAGNDAPLASALYARALDHQGTLANNILVGVAGQPAVFCDSNSPVFQSNDVFSPQAVAYAGACTDQTGANGNISADPLFVDPDPAVHDFHLQPGSPVIDAGDNSVTQLPATDFDGNSRILDGNGDCVAVVDMGAFEALSGLLNFSPATLTFGFQLLTTSGNPAPIVLRNPGTVPLHICAIAISGDFTETHSCAATLASGASCTINVFFRPSTTASRDGSLTITDSASASPHLVPLSGTGVDFAVSIAPGSQTVNYAQTATYTVSVLPQGGALNLPVALSCPNLPTGLFCVFSGNGFVTPGPTPGTSTLIISTIGLASSRPPVGYPGSLSTLALLAIPGVLPLLALLPRPAVRRRISRRLHWLLLALFLLALWGCAGGGNGGPTPGQPRTFTVTVAGTSGPLQRTASATLTVH